MFGMRLFLLPMGAKVHRILRVMATKKGGPEAALKITILFEERLANHYRFSVCRSFFAYHNKVGSFGKAFRWDAQ